MMFAPRHLQPHRLRAWIRRRGWGVVLTWSAGPQSRSCRPTGWRVFFAAVDISARNLELKAGDLFIVQVKGAIRDYLRGVVPDIDGLALHRVPLLKVLTVPPKAYLEILEKRANYDDAVAILRQRTGAQP